MTDLEKPIAYYGYVIVDGIIVTQSYSTYEEALAACRQCEADIAARMQLHRNVANQHCDLTKRGSS